jgi:hypothetical protein
MAWSKDGLTYNPSRRAVAVWQAKNELKEVEWLIKSADQCIDQINTNRDLAIMRRDALLKIIEGNEPNNTERP